MTVRDLYERFCAVFPESLREPWDNDGMMVCPDGSAEVNRALVALDVTEEVVDYAIESGFDLIVSHHPLVFHPMGAVTEEDSVQRRVIKLLQNGVSVFSFHTRADKAKGGVNDCLAAVLGLEDTEPFGEGGLGRIGNLPEPMSLEDFAYFVKTTLDSSAVLTADAYNEVSRVAIVGGDGKDFVKDAIAQGADTYLSGRIGYNMMEDAGSMGINLVEAGHYFTEFPVTRRFSELLVFFDPRMEVEVTDSNLLRLY